MKEGVNMQTLITKDDLMKLGFSKHTAIGIIRQSEEIIGKDGYLFYNNKRLDVSREKSLKQFWDVN